MDNYNNKDVRSLVDISNRFTASFNAMKIIAIVCIIGAALTAVVCIYFTSSSIAQANQHIYVLDKGQVMTASQQSASLTKLDEVKDHMTRFHELFFSVSPNADVIKSNLERALELSDKSVYKYYNDLAETGFYKRMISSNMSQQVQVDSVRVDMSRYPYPVITYCTQWITRTSNMTKYELQTRCSVIDVNRSEKNLHGLQIEKFEVIKNELIETRNR